MGFWGPVAARGPTTGCVPAVPTLVRAATGGSSRGHTHSQPRVFTMMQPNGEVSGGAGEIPTGFIFGRSEGADGEGKQGAALLEGAGAVLLSSDPERDLGLERGTE